LSYMHSFELEY